MTDSIRQLQKRYGSRVMTIAIFVGFACILFGYKSWGKGLILGSIFSVINFVLMGQSLPAAIQQSAKKSTIYSIRSIGFRYLLLAIPLFVAIRYPQFNLIAAIVGIFMIQIVILMEGIRLYFTNKTT
ncbi:MAG TPA: ATP synthase subunit I [Desulfatirhabdiaceae bacterium]|nr:ATP synthase subunit I [Desulfatirhabdiaceae bacterium]